MTAAERVSDINLMKDIHNLALTGKLLGVCCVDFGENWPRYDGAALYLYNHRIDQVYVQYIHRAGTWRAMYYKCQMATEQPSALLCYWC